MRATLAFNGLTDERRNALMLAETVVRYSNRYRSLTCLVEVSNLRIAYTYALLDKFIQ